MKKITVLSPLTLGLCASMLLATLSSAGILTHSGSSTGSRDNWTGTVGTRFTVGPSDIIINALGFEDAGANGLAIDHQVAIWSSASTMLTSATVPAGTSGLLVDAWRYVTVPQVTLLANTTYWIGGRTISGSLDAFTDVGDVAVSPFGLGSGIIDADPTNAYWTGTFDFPNSYGPYLDLRWAPANAMYVPEPSVLLGFLTAGSLGLLLLRRRRS